MSASPATSWHQAHWAPFEAFGILYYPLFHAHADLPTVLDDADMAWAVTANANLEGTGYTLSQPSVLTLASYHHAMAQLVRQATFLPLAAATDATFVNPLADVKRLVPDVTVAPMYPDFPSQVMEMSEAQYRYDQQMHYLSTYGIEFLAGLLGLDVTVSEGWMPQVEATPKIKDDQALVAPKVLHVLMTIEDLQAVVTARLARATRMHFAEIESTLLAFADLGNGDDEACFPKIAFHENMMELIRQAAWLDSATLTRTAAGFAQHPGDLLKATRYLLESMPGNHLLTRQKKGLCRAFERFGTRSIAQNIADAGRHDREVVNFLSVARFGGPRLREAIQLVESGEVRSWASELETHWAAVERVYDPGSGAKTRDYLAFQHAAGAELPEGCKPIEDAWRGLLHHYGRRPGVLLRSLSRLVKAGCPIYLLAAEVPQHVEAFSLPTLVSTVTSLAAATVDTSYFYAPQNRGGAQQTTHERLDEATRAALVSILRPLIEERMRSLETPLKGRRVFLDSAGISLAGSLMRPNEVGTTGTAWPPAGMAYDLPADKILRFFTFWDDRDKRVDVDLHFEGRTITGEGVHVGWNASFKGNGMVMSGDITTSHDSVEYLDIDMAAARKAGVDYMVQRQHIFAGADSWADIDTCYSGALLVADAGRDVKLYSGKNLLFRDDLTGTGRMMNYASINVPKHYVRILRGANLPLGDPGYSLADYLDTLFTAQEVTLVETPEEADLCVCVGRSDDPEVISLFDEGFYLG